MAQTFYPNAQTVIDAALRAIAVSDPEGGASPSTIERTNALEALNFLVTYWQADGMQVWCQKTGTHTLTVDTTEYTVGPGGAIDIARPTQVTQAWLRSNDTDPVDTPLNIVDRNTHNFLSTKTSSGTPNQLMYDPRYDMPAGNNGANAKGLITLWPAPTSTDVTTYDLHFVYTRPIQDFNAVTDFLDFPQEWFNAIKWNLAYQISFEYGTPVEILDRIRKIAEEEKARAMAFDTDQVGIFFQPDDR